MSLRPFFTYYGGKWRAAPGYPMPDFATIIEPFAGSAGYSLRHHERNVVLIEKDPSVAGVWRYLVGAKASEISRLPLIKMDQTIDDLKDIPQEAKWLIGFWLNKGTTAPARSPSAWMRGGIRPKSFWGPEIRGIIAGQVEKISHWKIFEGSYEQAPDERATWFIDAPYATAGRHYRCSAKEIDFKALGSWCRERRGQIIVCEYDDASWLPFKPHATIKANPSSRGRGYSAELIWTRSAA